MTFTLKGSPDRAKRSFVRAWLNAAMCVMEFHNRPVRRHIRVVFRKDLGDTELGGRCAGRYWREWQPGIDLIQIRRDLSAEGLATTVVHEVIHACFGGFGAGTDEKCTSTLTARLKPATKVIAEELLLDMQKRAAFVAHTKIAYRTTRGDHYDPAQHEKLGVKDRRS